MVERIGRALLAAFAILAFGGCDYGHKQYRPSTGASPSPTAPLVIEVDDFGRFWDRQAADATLETISRASLNKNTIVLAFIHGWHHNADAADANFQNFENALSHLRAKITQPEYVHARAQLNLQDDIQVMGLYVGWRGRSLPSVLDYFTFWGRKSAAERVGDGDLREFFIKLQKVYMERNSQPFAGKPTFMGLVTIGHSFGGQVLFKAVHGAFEKDLIDAAENAGNHPGKTRTKLAEVVSGLGDMTVLLNPALEAFQYERIHRLTTQLSFNEFQTPVLLTVSAEDDSARKMWFPIGRNINIVFRPIFPSDEEKRLWTTALGEYAPQRTHSLEVTKSPPTIYDSLYKDCKIDTVDFTNSLVLDGAQLAPNDSSHPYSPVVIAYTSNQLVQEHSGIFGETFSDFLTDYVAFVEGKRMCLIRGTRPVQVK